MLWNQFKTDLRNHTSCCLPNGASCSILALPWRLLSKIWPGFTLGASTRSQHEAIGLQLGTLLCCMTGERILLQNLLVRVAGSSVASCCKWNHRSNRHQRRTSWGNPWTTKLGSNSSSSYCSLIFHITQIIPYWHQWQSRDLEKVSLWFWTQLDLCSREELNLAGHNRKVFVVQKWF